VGTVGNAVPILIFRWERRSHTYSYFPMGTQFLQLSVTISIRPILVAQQKTILPLMNVFIYLRAVLRIMPPAGFKGPTSNGRGGEGRERERRGREGRGGRGWELALDLSASSF